MVSEAAVSTPSSKTGSHHPFGKVAVVMGGWSAEREVSLMSGNCVLEGLVAAGVDAHAVDADRHIIAELRAREFDRAFLILHGRGGEDGQLQGALDLAGIPYTGSGVLASALCMDKHRAKLLAANAGVKTPEAVLVNTLDEAIQATESIGLPVVIKPTHEGSSIGVSMVRSATDVEDAHTLASEYGPVLVEQMMVGMEVTAAIAVGQALPLVSMRAETDFYDYHAKYFAEDTQYHCPPALEPDVQKQIQQDALTVFNALGCRHWGRVDFMLDENGVPHFIECNTAPGMTTHSLVPMAAAAAGMSFSELVVSILAETLTETERAL
jgi:D-alanine-D-alanine ligase